MVGLHFGLPRRSLKQITEQSVKAKSPRTSSRDWCGTYFHTSVKSLSFFFHHNSNFFRGKQQPLRVNLQIPHQRSCVPVKLRRRWEKGSCFFHLGKPDLESDTLATPDWIDYIVCTNTVVDRFILCSSAETPIKALAWTHHRGLSLIRFVGVKTLRRTKRPLMPGWCQQKESLDKGGGVQEQNDGEGERRKNGGGSKGRMGNATIFFFNITICIA